MNENNNSNNNNHNHTTGDSNINDFYNEDSKKYIFEYINLIKNNLTAVLVIFIASVTASVIYLYNTPSIYRAQTQVKIEQNEPDILDNNSKFGMMAPTNNFMPNQIQLLQSYEIRDRVAAMLINSTKGTNEKSIFFHLVRNGKPSNPFLSREELRLKLGNIVKISQVGELNTINIFCRRPIF